MQYTLFTDGGSRGNPGAAASSCLLFDDAGKLVSFDGEYLGEATNNFAEYHALILGLKLAQKCGVGELVVKMDSELIVKQITGEYQVKDPQMKELHAKAKQLLTNFSYTFQHVPRAQNHFADRMVNLILDQV